MRKDAYLLISTLSMMGALCGFTMPPASSAAQPVASPTEKKASSVTALECLRTRHRHGAVFLSGASSKLKKDVKLPEAVGVMCSELQNFIGEGLKTCITRTRNDGDWEAIVIDLNDNADLTDDKAIALPGPETVEKFVIERDGKAHFFTASMLHDRYAARLTLSPVDFLSGSTTVVGEMIEWAACDCNLSGALDAGDMAYLGRKGNRSESRENLIRLGPDALLVRDGKWYMVSASADGNMLIGPYRGVTSTWTIDHSSILRDKDAPHTISFRSAENQATLMDASPGAGLAVPSRVWRRIYGYIKAEPKTITYRITQLDLSKDAVLKLEKPVAKLLLRQRGDKITVDLKINAAPEVNYVLERTETGPLVEVFSDDQPGKPISTGNMEYG